jgi:hypothetical protein
VPPLQKKAGEKCKHQKFGKGCAVYHRAGFPPECGWWSCRWLASNDTADLSRPDRSHYVIDVMPDYITLTHNETGEQQNIQVVQIWCDPKHPDAHRDPALREYLRRRGDEGIMGLVRYGVAHETLMLVPPQMVADGQWHEVDSTVVNVSQEKEHTLTDMMRALGGEARMVIDP